MPKLQNLGLLILALAAITLIVLGNAGHDPLQWVGAGVAGSGRRRRRGDDDCDVVDPTAERTFDLFGLPMGAAGLSAAAPSAAVATVTAAAPRLLAFGTSVAPPPRRTAQHNDQVPKKVPGEKGIMRPNMAPFLLVIFSLMDTVRPHVEVGHRNSRATSKWKEL